MSRILVIDDDPQIRSLLREILTDESHDVVEASDGAEGIRRLREHAVDIVITDLIMPKQEGLETILMLRREFPNIAVIAISGGGRKSPTDYLVSARLLGARRVIPKPFKAAAIIEAVAELLASPR